MNFLRFWPFLKKLPVDYNLTFVYYIFTPVRFKFYNLHLFGLHLHSTTQPPLLSQLHEQVNDKFAL